MEDLLLDTLVEVVGDRADEHALREVGDFEAGISVSNCVLVEVVTFSFDTECDSRSCTILPKRSDKVRAVSPTTCPEKILPTVLVMTLASFSP